jgi:hypothetical protein
MEAYQEESKMKKREIISDRFFFIGIRIADGMIFSVSTVCGWVFSIGGNCFPGSQVRGVVLLRK